MPMTDGPYKWAPVQEDPKYLAQLPHYAICTTKELSLKSNMSLP